MTIKNLGLSAIAIAVLSTGAFAGTVANSAGVGLVGQEKLSISDVNVSDVFGNSSKAKVVYTPTQIPATSLKNPVFVFTFANAKDIVAASDGKVSVFECQGDDSNVSAANWKLVANNPQISGDNNEKISFNAIDSDIYAYNGKKYVIADANGTDASSIPVGGAEVQVTVVKGSAGDLTLQAELYSGDSQTRADLAPATAIAKVGPEFTGSVIRKFNNTIDASNSFYTFHDYDADAVEYPEQLTTDVATFNIHKNATLSGASLGAGDVTLDVLYDQNTSKYIDQNLSGFAGLDDQNLGDLNATATISGYNTQTIAHDYNASLVLVVFGNVEIKKTLFGAHAYVVSGDNKFDVITQGVNNAGEWTIYGYNAQIPNVVSIDGKFDTTMKFTNRSTLDTNIYFTLMDQDGTVVTLSSVDNPTLASLSSNTTGVYTASELLALVTDPDFDKSGSFSVEVSIPTTPSNVYGFASFKNLTLGQFKDLPIYNTSSMDTPPANAVVAR